MITALQLSDILRLPGPTTEQIAVIQAPLEPALVVAGAGSGKTETMAARVLFLVANGMVRPEQVLGLTFTRKAASGLAARIRQRLRTLAASGYLGPGAAGGEPEVSTYHSFGGRLITEFGPLAGVEPAVSVLSATGSWQLARRVVGRWDGDLETDLGPDQVTERLLAMAGGLADHLTTSQALAAEIESVLATLHGAPPSPAQRGAVHSGLAGYLKRLQDRAWILPLVDAFTKAKRQSGVIDFADQMEVAAALVTAHPRIGQALRERYAVVLLDEYQDTGHAQRVILRAAFADTGHAGRPAGHPVTAVGDPVQSIYSWRGASASNLPRFPVDFPRRGGTPAATLTLSTSFRNAVRVLEIANRISAPVRNGAVQVRQLRPRTGAGSGVVHYGLFETAAQEESWVARQIARRWSRSTTPEPPADGSDLPGVSELPPTTAVLMRRRRDMEAMAIALRAAGLPVEVVGLGGLLSEPEVADLLALLQVLVDPTAGPAALRLLTGARWQLGMADLAALAARATALAPRGPGPGPSRRTDSVVGADRVTGADRAAVQAALAGAGSGEDIDSASLVDAVSDPGAASAYSAEGLRRIHRFGAELHRLRSRLSLPLPDLVAELERTTGLDVEVRTSSPAGRAHLDAFADVVADFAATGGTPVELVEYLLTAAEREDGLTPGEVVAAPGRVQILTVHAAKGLEWEIVAVPHLSDTVFPSARGSTWLGDAAQLPPALRGDRADLPVLSLPVHGDQKDMVAALAAHTEDLKADLAVEERRLLYVAVTRAEHTLLVSGHQWGRTSSKARGPSEFLREVHEVASAFGPPDSWAAAPAADDVNPMMGEPRSVQWPPDALGGRRAGIEHGAALVREAMSRSASEPPEQIEMAAVDPHGWRRDVRALLAERAAFRSRSFDVELPQTISATALVELADDPGGLARRVRRPIPHAPTPDAQRGTAFHAWLERFFTASALVEIDDLPGANDRGRPPDPEIEALQKKFLASVWAGRVPFEVELPFSMVVAGQPVRGRVDAVFRDDDGGCTVVDWKTGRPPGPERRTALTVQLAVYRVAVAEMFSLPLDKVRAAFVYVAADQTFAPADLLDPAGLAALFDVAVTPSTVTSSTVTPSTVTSSTVTPSTVTPSTVTPWTDDGTEHHSAENDGAAPDHAAPDHAAPNGSDGWFDDREPVDPVVA